MREPVWSAADYKRSDEALWKELERLTQPRTVEVTEQSVLLVRGSYRGTIITARNPPVSPDEIRSVPALAGIPLREAIRGAVHRFLDQRYQVFLFGSEAAGGADRRSDIDIGILGPQPVPGAILQQIRDELDTLRTLRTFDVVDFSRADDSFRAEALRHAEPL